MSKTMTRHEAYLNRDLSPATEEKFWKYVEKLPDGCWRWTGSKCSGGQGGMHWNGERIHARRIAWAIVHGYVPERMLKSRCRKTWCVSPHHAYQALDPADAPVIIAAWRAGDTHKAIAARYGCSRETVTRFIGAHISEVAA